MPGGPALNAITRGLAHGDTHSRLNMYLDRRVNSLNALSMRLAFIGPRSGSSDSVLGGGMDSYLELQIKTKIQKKLTFDVVLPSLV